MVKAKKSLEIDGGGGPFFGASGYKNIGANIRMGREIRCLPYAGFFTALVGFLTVLLFIARQLVSVVSKDKF